MKNVRILLWETYAICHKIPISKLDSIKTFPSSVKKRLHANEWSQKLNFESCFSTSVRNAKVQDNLELIAKNILDSTPYSHIEDSSNSCSSTEKNDESFSTSEKEELIKAELIKSLAVLFSCGLKNTDIRKHYDILKNHSSYSKVSCLTKIHQNPNKLLPLLILPVRSLQQAAIQADEDKSLNTGFENRISYLQHHLELSLEELVHLLTKHASLLKMPFYKLDIKMKILKNAKISVESIVKDLWIFNYNENLLNSRVQAAQRAGVILKPWLLHCSQKYFYIWLSKSQETQNILKGEDQVRYLAKKLNCSESYVQYMMEKNVHLSSTNVRKLEKVIDFLYEKGYTAEEICLFPKVFCSNVETLQKRYEEIQKAKGIIPSLPAISISYVFKRILEKHITF